MRSYRSLVLQSLVYFSRPHERVRRTPLTGAAAWTREDLASRQESKVTLDANDVDELENAIDHARSTKKRMGALHRRDFPLPALAPRIADWRRELASGTGVVLVSGLPVERWGRADSELAFWCLGLHLGIPGAQNPEGDLLGHVTDTGASPSDPTVRAYRTASNIAYHCDAADVVGLCCLRPALRGGTSRIVSSVAVYNELLRRRPDLVERLYQPFALDTHGEGGVDHIPIPPCRYAEGKLRTFYHSDYFRSAELHARIAQLTPEERELLDLYDEIARQPELYFDMDLRPGDVQLLSNHTVLHSRTAYEDPPEPERRRHLLRLWLSLPARRSPKLRALAALSGARLLRDLVVRRLARVA